jgi:tungstate transport system substrate-binding protein
VTRHALAAMVVALLALASCGGGDGDGGSSGAPSGRMIMATTTSTRDSGLLDVLVPAFERSSECSVKTLAVGSGEALELGERGNADVLLVHSPAAEEKYMRGGHGLRRDAVMHNDFVLVGPPSDPAQIAGASGAADAMRRIARARARFASRGDDSGTNAKELTLWAAAGVKPHGSWYFETGQGMGQTLTIASQKRAYTLSDRGTFLATSNLDLKVLTEGGKDLLNPYHVIPVKARGVNTGCAKAFDRWLTSAPTQKLIASFGVRKYGRRLFFPDARR